MPASASQQRARPGRARRLRVADSERRRGTGRPSRRGGAAILTAVIVAVLGVGSYFAVQLVSRSPEPGAAPPSALHRTSPAASPAASTPAPAPPHPAGQAGDYRIAGSRYTFTEHPAKGAAARVLPVVVRFPVTTAAAGVPQGGFPLIVFAPGYRQCDGVYSALLSQWASAGYVVAAVEFPMTNCHVAQPDESDLPNQPADMSFVIHRLITLSADPGDRLTGLITASRVAVAGHSDGGDTVAAMAAASCCRDPSLRAVVVLAGAEWAPLTGRWFGAPTPPALFVQGTADSWNPPAASMQLYESDTRGIRYYLELFGANHFTPYQGTGTPEPIVERVTLGFLDHYLAGQPGGVSAMRRAGRVPGISELASGGRMP